MDPCHALCMISVAIVLGSVDGYGRSFDTVITEMYINGKNRNVTSVWGVLHSAVSLPCDLSPPQPEDRPNLVLWYRGSSLEPIYSYDARGVAFEDGVPWTADSRNSFTATPTIGNLNIANVSVIDSGIYRCRVDYKRAPATDYFFNVSLIIPPPIPTIVNSAGNEISLDPVVFKEGDTLRLSCSVREGWPIPTLVWRVDGQVADSIQLITSTGYPRSDFVIPYLTRNDLNKMLTCEASNDNYTESSIRHVTIDMNLPPVSVKIDSPNAPLLVGKPREFICETFGSKPKPRITWWLGSKHLRSDRETVSGDGNVSTSFLTLTPSVADNGKLLSCQADNNKFLDQASPVEQEIRLVVHYPPIVNLKFGRNVDFQTIAVNHDVYLECFIDANPKILKVEWKHDGDLVRHDPSNGIILANHTLVLQKIQRRSSGIYVCYATNSLRTSESNPIFLQVKYPPMCAGQSETKIVLSVGEEVNVTCRVDGDPSQGMSFSWTFNTTKGLAPVPQNMIDDSHVREGMSSVSLRVQELGDFGTLFCSARNAIGTQPVPCRFQIVRGEKPGPLTNCTSFLPSPGVVAISCEPGSDGGIQQMFHLEIYSSSSFHVDSFSANLVANLTSSTPDFEIKGLGKDQQDYTCVAYSSNLKGTSDTLSFTFKLDDIQWKDSAVKTKNRPQSILLSSALGSLGTGIVLAFGCYCFAAKCYNRKKRSRTPQAQTWVAREQRQSNSAEGEMSLPSKRELGNSSSFSTAKSALVHEADSSAPEQSPPDLTSAALFPSVGQDSTTIELFAPLASPRPETLVPLNSFVSSNVGGGSGRTVLASPADEMSGYPSCITIVTTPQTLMSMHDVESIV